MIGQRADGSEVESRCKFYSGKFDGRSTPLSRANCDRSSESTPSLTEDFVEQNVAFNGVVFGSGPRTQ